MNQNNQNDSGVLPFETNESDVVEGIGVSRIIIKLEEKCYICGYDRGLKTTHTEVEGHRIECNHCGVILEDS